METDPKRRTIAKSRPGGGVLSTTRPEDVHEALDELALELRKLQPDALAVDEVPAPALGTGALLGQLEKRLARVEELLGDGATIGELLEKIITLSVKNASLAVEVRRKNLNEAAMARIEELEYVVGTGFRVGPSGFQAFDPGEDEPSLEVSWRERVGGIRKRAGLPDTIHSLGGDRLPRAEQQDRGGGS